MNKVVNIAKNTSYLTLALILQKIISFTYFMLLARYIGPAYLGKYYLAISLTTIFAIFIDLGFANVLTREVAKKEEEASRWLGNILSMKIPLSFLALVLVFVIVNILGYDQMTKNLAYISCIPMILDSFTNTFFSTSRGKHNLKYESFSSVIFQLIVLCVGYGALLLGHGLIFAMAALALASTFNFCYSFFVVAYKLKVKIKLIFERNFIREVLTLSWPFAVFAIFQRLYMYLDSVLLSVMSGDEQVGLYQVAFKIIYALQFLPLAFTASLYPALSTYWKHNREQLGITFERAMNYLIIISLPIVFGIFALADKVVFLFESDYAAAALPLKISIISLFFIFLNFPIGSLLNACDAQRRNTRNMIIVTIVSVVLNFLLIKNYQSVGASITVLVTNALMFVLGLIEAKKIIGRFGKRIRPVFLKSFLASLVMAAIVFIGKSYLNVFPSVVIGGAVYFVVLFLVGGFRREDILSVVASFKRKKI